MLSRTSLLFVCLALAGSLCACSGSGSTNPSVLTGNQPLQSGGSVPRAAVASTTTTPTHIATWAFDEYNGPGSTATAAQVQEYLTYAEGGIGNVKALDDCAGSGTCSSVLYMDPNFVYAGTTCPMGASAALADDSAENWYLHEAGYTDFAHRLHGEYTMTCDGATITIPVYVLNDYNSEVQSFFRDYLRDNANSWNYYFMDDTSGEELTQLYGPGGGFCTFNPPDDYCTTNEELPTNATIAYEHESFANAMTHTDGSPMQFFYNGATFSNQEPDDLDVLTSSKNYVGVACEGCVVNGETFNASMYAEVLNTMADVDNIPGASFVELSKGDDASGSAAQIAERVVTTAMAWLGYSAGHTIVFPDLEYNTTNLAAWPEDSIVPAEPVETMSSGAANIEVATGVYRREFASCTNAGTAIGPCAAFVNSTGAAVKVLSSWLHETYGHVITLYGGDVTHGGEVLLTTTTFTPNVTTIPADQGLMISR